jgi:hypothetical protein
MNRTFRTTLAMSTTRAALLAVLAMSAAAAAKADLLIVSSDVAALKAGSQLSDADRLDLPAGVKVRVLLPSGKTQLLTGPVSGFVRDITKGERMAEGIWSKAKDLFETGGIDQSKMGAVRSFKPPPKPVSSAFAWNMVPASASGPVCVEKGAKILIERADGDKSPDLIVVDAGANTRATVAFSDGTRQADWPAGVALKPDATYQLVPSGGRLRQITLRLVDKAMTDEKSALQALLERDCRTQAKAWLGR